MLYAMRITNTRASYKMSGLVSCCLSLGTGDAVIRANLLGETCVGLSVPILVYKYAYTNVLRDIMVQFIVNTYPK